VQLVLNLRFGGIPRTKSIYKFLWQFHFFIKYDVEICLLIDEIMYIGMVNFHHSRWLKPRSNDCRTGNKLKISAK